MTPPAGFRRVVIAGVSTRAAAESAALAGFEVTSIDAFGDLDQHPAVRVACPPSAFSHDDVAAASRDFDCDAVVYLAGFENHPSAVATLAEGRVLWGNTPEVLRRVRDPALVTDAFRNRGHPAPDIRELPPGQGRWLLKPVARGGGHRVRDWSGGPRLPAGCYLQEFVEGSPGAVVFVAAEGRAVPLGVSRQIIGEARFGGSGYQYCGSILSLEEDPGLVRAACALARTAAEEFRLVGVNGIDFVARGHVPYPVEVNPRWTASMELVERAYGVSVFGAHAGACATATLPTFDLQKARRHAGALGKAVVFARTDVRVGKTTAWLHDDAHVRDVPHRGDRIEAGRPVCTVFATGENADDCRKALIDRARRIYVDLADWARS